FVPAYAAAGITDTHEAVDRDIAEDFLEAGLWVFMRAGNPDTAWHALDDIIKIVHELHCSTKRICLCTDDRDADDLFLFGLDWCARQAFHTGIGPLAAWSMASLHPATRYRMEDEVGGLGHSRRADIVLLDDAFKVQNTWYGGQLMVEDGKVTSQLDQQMEHQRWTYPQAAYQTVKLPSKYQLTPDLPSEDVTANVIHVVLPGVVTFLEQVKLEAGKSWEQHFKEHDVCFVTVIERHGNNGATGYGLLKGFNLTSGAVASSVGHDAHNIIVAGTNEADMRLAVETIAQHSGGLVIVEDGKVQAVMALPLAGLLSDKRATQVRDEMIRFKEAWEAKGLGFPYMGFNLIPLSVIPQIRLTDQGLVLVEEMRIIPLFEPAD
ncbi:MAG: adenine deaminase, partial [Anaerolineales bacterium]|nr:adenine deaminase [Anaerolineales bacterium]